MKTKTLLLVFWVCSFFSTAQINTIPNSGRVGIGTTNPHAALEVNGNLEVDSSMIIKDSLTVEQNARIVHDIRVEGATELENVIINGTTWMKTLQSVDEDDYGIMVAKSDGTLMKSNVKDLFDWEPTKEPEPAICLQGSTYRQNPYWSSSVDKLVTFCPDVHVGIAKTDPRVQLDIAGTTFSTRLFMGQADPLNTPAGLYFHLKAPYSDNSLNRTLFKIENDNRQLFSVNNNGLIRSREVKIDATTWADYVFHSDYKLRTLSEVESYIEENGHLPDVPSEEEVLEEGINIAEMNVILLQKIEELTLYTIELEKRLKEVENQNK